jgi:uncharacterized oxidoreductase
MQLKNKTILITGGSSGIGFELTRRLLALGNTVIITGRDAARLEAAKRALPAVHIIRSDVSDAEAIATLHAQVIAQFPTLDVLVNNAGIMRNLDLNDTRHGVADITREIDINLSGPLRMVQQFLPHLKTQQEAAIVNVSSGLAFVPFRLVAHLQRHQGGAAFLLAGLACAIARQQRDRDRTGAAWHRDALVP